MPDDHAGRSHAAGVFLESWLFLLRSVRVALDVRKLVLAAVAMCLVGFGWWISGQVFAGSNRVASLVEQDASFAGHPLESLDTAPTSGMANEGGIDFPGDHWFTRNVLWDAWWAASRPFRNLFALDQSYVEFAFWLLCAMLTVAVWALAGVAITRMAALELTREGRPGPKAALAYARRRWGSAFFAPIYPIVGALLVSIPMIFLGWLLRSDAGLLVAAIVWPVLLLLAAVAVVMLLAILVGWPLMFAAVSAEGADSFDAMSRTYAYVYQRPLHLAVYAVVASVLGSLGWLVIAVFSATVVHLTFWGVSWSAGRVQAAEVWSELPAAVQMTAAPEVPQVTPDEGETAPPRLHRAAVWLLAVWIGAVKLLALAFAYSYLWTASTAIYLLLRRDVDATELDEVFLEDEDENYGLPAIERDEKGAPVAVEPEDEEGDATASQIDETVEAHHSAGHDDDAT